MEPVSNQAKAAVEQRANRYYDKAALEDEVGVSVGECYICRDGRFGTFILHIEDITHADDPVDESRWFRERGTTEEEFIDGIEIHAVAFEIDHMEIGGIYATGAVLERPTLRPKAVSHYAGRRYKADDITETETGFKVQNSSTPVLPE